MKKIFKLAALVAASLAIFSCTPEDNPGNNGGENNGGENNGNTNVTLNQNLKFTLGTPETEADKATIRVEHNGAKTDPWYWIVTTESDVNAAVTAEVAKLTTPIQGLKKTAKTDVTVRDLEPETEYTFVVFGLSENGEVYGETKSVEFTTKRGEVEFTVNPAWTVEYSGPKDYESQGQTTTYKHTATVTSTDDNSWFLSTAWNVTDFEASVEEYGIEAILDYEFRYFISYIESINEYYGYNTTVADWLYTGTNWDVIDVIPGDWYVMAIGVGEDGELSGLYAISDVITITEEEATAAYSAWLGDWTLSDAEGTSFNITFHKGINNEIYYMTGWEGIPDLPVEVEWDEDTEAWMIYSQSLGELEFEGGEVAAGWFTPIDSENYIYPAAGYPICYCINTENGPVVYGYVDDSVKMVSMCYLADFGNKDYYGLTEEATPMFPLTVEPATDETPEGTPDQTHEPATLSKMNKKVHFAANEHKLQNGRKFHNKVVRKF